MDSERSKQLITRYPLLYRRGMYFECGDGWFDLIDRLSKQLEEMIPKQDATHLDGEGFEILATQVKEKWGTLHFYLSSAPDCMWEAIFEASKESATICECCGVKGEIRKGGWIMTLCDGCHENRLH